MSDPGIPQFVHGATSQRLLWFLLTTAVAIIIAIMSFTLMGLARDLRDTKSTLALRAERIAILEQEGRALDFRITQLERDAAMVRYGCQHGCPAGSALNN